MMSTTSTASTTDIIAATTNNSPNNRRDENDTRIRSGLFILGWVGVILGIFLMVIGFPILLVKGTSGETTNSVELYFKAGLSAICSGVFLSSISAISMFFCSHVANHARVGPANDAGVEDGKRAQNNNSLAPVVAIETSSLKSVVGVQQQQNEVNPNLSPNPVQKQPLHNQNSAHSPLLT